MSTLNIFLVVFLLFCYTTAVAQDRVLFNDDFEDNSNRWVNENLADHSCIIKDGYFTIQNKTLSHK